MEPADPAGANLPPDDQLTDAEMTLHVSGQQNPRAVDDGPNAGSA